MFRTCERYLSGGISDVELSLQAVRDQRLIVSILAIEGLTGAVTPKPVVNGASASGSSGASGANAAIRLDDQHKLVGKKAEALDAKEAALATLNGSTKDCDTIAKAVADKKEDGLSKELKDKKPKCDAAAAELAAATKDKNDAEAHYRALLTVAGAAGVPAAASGTVMAPAAGGGLDAVQRSDMGQVAQAVKDIVEGTFNQDEYLFLCLKVLQSSTGDKVSGAQGSCLAYINSRVELERARNASKAANIDAASQEIQQRAEPLFEQFWALVGNGDLPDSGKLKAVKDALRPADWPACFTGARNRADYQRCFTSNAVPAGVKRDLAKGKHHG